MIDLAEIFSWLCGRGRCFVVDGQALPVCQRCFGLYVGAAVTGGWLAATGIFRRGLPSRSVFVVNLAMLAAAAAGGLHLIDAGPVWRSACGMWTAHVAMLWLAGGAAHLERLRRRLPQLPWRRGDKIQALLAGPVLAGLACLTPTNSQRNLWSAAVAAGAICLAIALAAAAISAGAYLAGLLRSARRRGLE